MDLGITGKIALITGAGRGLGRNMALCLAREGVTVLINSRNQSDLDSLLSELPASKIAIPHQHFCEDLASEAGSKRLIAFCADRQIEPDIVIHNVGGNLNITDPLCSVEDWRQVLRLNLEIPIELNRYFIPRMQKKKWGRVCHVSSISGLENQGPPPYCAAKAGLVAYARSLGRYVAKDGVIVTSILPGAVYTEGGYWDLTAKTRPDHVAKYLSERMAIQRFGKPEEIGEVVTFLCSNHASFCVGSAFLVDGGQGRVFFNQEAP